MAKLYQTTVDDFKIFKTECQRWIEILGLKGWKIFYEHNDSTIDAYAHFSYNQTSKQATITLTKTWKEEKPSKEFIQQTAFHEICEIFLAKIRTLAEDRSATENNIIEEIHTIVRTLENVLWKPTLNKQS